MTEPTGYDVSVDIDGETVAAGTAYFSRRRGNLTTTFNYLPSYIADRRAYALDPSLPLFRGQHINAGLPGAFADCAPDRWGRRLIDRRLELEATVAGRRLPDISDVDYLLGVSDETRQGALRFSRTGTSMFLSPATSVPKLIDLPQLMRAADEVERDDTNLEAIKALLDAGTGTLGGARPKASVRDGDTLYIAKFPRPGDKWDVIAWEKTALDLAANAGISVPPRELLTIDGRAVLLIERFDRRDGKRIGYMSAMTMTQAHDGDRADYVDVAEAFTEYGADVTNGLTEWWRRIAFSVAIHNTDDHLRNHGLLQTSNGWGLSPLFDVNPNPQPQARRSTAIGGATTRDGEIEGLFTYAATFGLTRSAATSVISDVLGAVRGWRGAATANGLSASEIARMEPAFQLADHLAAMTSPAVLDPLRVPPPTPESDL